MVQVSYPGVYVQEVPSGARAITGVATSIAAFVGMAKRGPINAPVQVLSFADYERRFSDDTSQGEMTDQVRQFFLNGGQRAFVTRVGSFPDEARANIDLTSFMLFSRDVGADANQLRARIDYDTPAPGSTFNLTLFRESFDSAGNATTSDEETHTALSLHEENSRFVVDVLQRESRLATAVLGTLTGGSGLSRSGLIANDVSSLESAIGAATGPVDGRFVMEVDGLPPRTVVVANATSVTAATIMSNIETAFESLLNPADITVSTPSFAGGTVLEIEVVGRAVRISSAPQSDIAAAIGLGFDNGGYERGPFASDRPAAGGVLYDDDPATWALLDRATVTAGTFELVGPEGFDVSLAELSFPGSGTTFAEGTTPGDHLANVRENLDAIATLVNRTQTNWLAAVHGFRLALTPRFGSSAVGATVVVNDPFGVGTTSTAAAYPLGGAPEGTVATLPEYREAFEALDKEVDLFNLLVLPRSAADTDGSIRATVWGPASSFCFEQRAFLLVDAAPGLTDVAEVPAAVRALRIGLKKDHAGFYWPRVDVSSQGVRKTLDPSGTIAGLMARTDTNRGVWKAPAGLEAELLGTLGTEVRMSDRENGTLNPDAVNAIRAFSSGIISWGARTMDGFDNSGNLDYKYVPVRRIALFIAESLERGLRFAVFEPNDEPLWAQIRLAAGGFMNNLFRQGAFQGSTAREAYFVKVDSETTTQNDINLGIVNVAVGFAPLRPAEFVVVTLQQKAGQIQV